MRKIKVFVSSPGDLSFERKRLQEIVIGLNGDYVGVAQIELYLWEESFYSAEATYQKQISPTFDSDIVISMFWTRLGKELPAGFVKETLGETAFTGEMTGSTYELMTALEAARSGKPKVFVFRKTEEPTYKLTDAKEHERAVEDWNKVEGFFSANFKDPDRGLIPYEAFQSTDDFGERVKALLEHWIEKHVLGASDLIWSDRRGSPFPGLVAYDLAHADVYFGRSRKVANAVGLLKQAAERGFPVLFILGPSGAGKSSLMRAGLAPRITTVGAVEDVDAWRIATMRPGSGSPFRALAKALLGDPDVAPGDPRSAGALPELLASDFGSVGLLSEQLAAANRAAIAPIVSALGSIARARKEQGGYHRELGANLLLLIDQFEDVFDERFGPQSRKDFASLIEACARSGCIWIVSTMRADLYDRFIEDFIVLQDKASEYTLAPPRESELAEIIDKSADAAGLTYETDTESGRRLDEILLEDARDANSLPLLQFALKRLYEECVAGQAPASQSEPAAPADAASARETSAAKPSRLLTLAAYRGFGGIAGAIDTAAEAAIGRVSDVNPKGLERALQRLLRLLVIQVEDRRSDAVGREAFAARPVPFAGLPGDLVTHRLVDELVDARILVADGIARRKGKPAGVVAGTASATAVEPETKGAAADAATLRIAHERVLESWQRAKRFLAAEKFFFQTRSDIESLHLRWQRKRSLGQLIPLGPSLKAASELRRSYGDELPVELSAFIDRSVLRGKLWNVAYWVVAGVLLATAGAATWFGLQAAENSRVAEKNYAVARDQVNSLIQQIANQFENTYGLRKDVVTAILSVIQQSVDRLSLDNPDPALRKSRGDMLYRFAKIYRKTGQNDRKDDGTIGPAEDAALKSFAIRDELAAKTPGDDALQGDLGDAHELLGDVYRDRAFDIQKDKALFESAREQQQAAFAIRDALLKHDPKNRRWRFGVSFSNVRLGDLDVAFTRGKPFEEARPELEASLAKYRKAADIADSMSLDFPGDAEIRKEIAFTLQKIGDGESRLKHSDLARAPYERSACIRTEYYKKEPNNAKAKDDLAFILGKISALPVAAGDFNEYAQALSFKSLSIRRELADSDLSNADWSLFLADALASIGQRKLERETVAAFWFLFESRDRLAALHQRFPAEGRFDRSLKDVEKRLAEARDMLRGQSVVVSELRDGIYAQIAAEEKKYLELFDAKYSQFFDRRC